MLPTTGIGPLPYLWQVLCDATAAVQRLALKILSAAPESPVDLRSMQLVVFEGEWTQVRVLLYMFPPPVIGKMDQTFTISELGQPLPQPPRPRSDSILKTLTASSACLRPAPLSKGPFTDITLIPNTDFDTFLTMGGERLRPLVNYLNDIKLTQARSAFLQNGYDFASLILGVLTALDDASKKLYLDVLARVIVLRSPEFLLDITQEVLDWMLDSSLSWGQGDFKSVYELRIRFACLLLRWNIFKKTYEDIKRQLGSLLTPPLQQKLQYLLALGFYPLSGSMQDDIQPAMMSIWNTPHLVNLRAHMYAEYRQNLNTVFCSLKRGDFRRWLESLIENLDIGERGLILNLFDQDHSSTIQESFQILILNHMGILKADTTEWIIV
jgi:hypothetical protein